MGAIIVYLFLCSLSGTVGYAIGSIHHRGGAGFWWAAIFGPFAWPFLLLLRDLRPRCSECKGRVPEGAARCMHCGVAFQDDEVEADTTDATQPVWPRSDEYESVRAQLALSSDVDLQQIAESEAGEFKPEVIAIAGELLALRAAARKEELQDG